MNDHVTRILTYEWNPTGDPAEVLAHHDYSAYTPRITEMIRRGGTEKEISDELFRLEKSELKLHADRGRCDRVARLSVGLRRRSATLE